MSPPTPPSTTKTETFGIEEKEYGTAPPEQEPTSATAFNAPLYLQTGSGLVNQVDKVVSFTREMKHIFGNITHLLSSFDNAGFVHDKLPILPVWQDYHQVSPSVYN
jgi:hypothetical protein